MIYNKVVALLVDEHDLQIFCVNGNLEFCLKTFGNSLSDDFTKLMPTELVSCMKKGKVKIVYASTEFVHDNKVDENLSVGTLCDDIEFEVFDLLECNFELDKKFGVKYKKQLSRLKDKFKTNLVCLKNLKKGCEYEIQ